MSSEDGKYFKNYYDYNIIEKNHVKKNDDSDKGNKSLVDFFFKSLPKPSRKRKGLDTGRIQQEETKKIKLPVASPSVTVNVINQDK